MFQSCTLDEGPWLPRKERYFQLAAQKRPSELLAVCTQDVFFTAELQKSPAGNLNLQDADFCRCNGIPPEGREAFLSDADFQLAFGMDKLAFIELKNWKQINAKKALHLF